MRWKLNCSLYIKINGGQFSHLQRKGITWLLRLLLSSTLPRISVIISGRRKQTHLIIYTLFVVHSFKIYERSNPKGAETLPPGIIVSESDLYQHRLWGNYFEVPNIPFKRNQLMFKLEFFLFQNIARDFSS